MRLWPIRNSCLVCAVAAIGMGTTLTWGQTESPPKPVSLGAQAVAVVLKHYGMNPFVRIQATGLPLPADGNWSLSKTRPPSCPQTDERCVEVFYDVPAEQVRCSWVVLLNADASDGTFLDENDDAAKYLARVVSRSEEISLINTRKNPVYPPIAIAAHVQGDVLLNVFVDKLGGFQGARVLSGNAMLQQASIDAANKWTFKPLMVGARALPYQVKLAFSFRLLPLSGSIMARATGDLAP